MNADDIITLWQAWDETPSNKSRVNLLVSAVATYVGSENSNTFYQFVGQRRRAGRSLQAAIYAWPRP